MGDVTYFQTIRLRRFDTPAQTARVAQTLSRSLNDVNYQLATRLQVTNEYIRKREEYKQRTNEGTLI